MNRNDIYKCNVCGAVVETIVSGTGTPMCCGDDMEFLEPKNEPEGLGQKHVPIVESEEKGTKVRMGKIQHPMEESHHIVFVELLKKGEVHRRYLEPGQEPEALFSIKGEFGAREYCNLHGLWEK